MKFNKTMAYVTAVLMTLVFLAACGPSKGKVEIDAILDEIIDEGGDMINDIYNAKDVEGIVVAYETFTGKLQHLFGRLKAAKEKYPHVNPDANKLQSVQNIFLSIQPKIQERFRDVKDTAKADHAKRIEAATKKMSEATKILTGK